MSFSPLLREPTRWSFEIDVDNRDYHQLSQSETNWSVPRELNDSPTCRYSFHQGQDDKSECASKEYLGLWPPSKAREFDKMTPEAQ